MLIQKIVGIFDMNVELIKEWLQRLVSADPVRFCYKESSDGIWMIIDNHPERTKIYCSTSPIVELWMFVGPLWSEFMGTDECTLFAEIIWMINE